MKEASPTPSTWNDALVFGYPKSMQWLLPLLVVFIVGVAFIPLCVAVFEPAPMWRRVVLALTSLPLAWFASVGVRLLPYVRARITVADDGLHIATPTRGELIHRWSSLGRIRTNDPLQVLDVFDKTGQRVLSVDYVLSRFSVCREQLYEHISRKA